MARQLFVLRKEIDRMNMDIVDMFWLRLRYPFCGDVYRLPRCELSDLGYGRGSYDVWVPLYARLLEPVCRPGSPDQTIGMAGFLSADLPLFYKIIKRVEIGKDVAEAKAAKGMPASESKREGDIVAEMQERGERYGIGPGDVAILFRGIIKWNKEIQAAHRAMMNSTPRTVRTCRTSCKGDDVVIRAIVAVMKHEAEILSGAEFMEQDKYGVSVDEEDGLTVAGLCEM